MTDKTAEEIEEEKRSGWSLWTLGFMALIAAAFVAFLPKDMLKEWLPPALQSMINKVYGWLGAEPPFPEADQQLNDQLVNALKAQFGVDDAVAKDVASHQQAFAELALKHGAKPEELTDMANLPRLVGNPAILNAWLQNPTTSAALLKLAGGGAALSAEITDMVQKGELKAENLAPLLAKATPAQFREVLTSHVIDSLSPERMKRLMTAPTIKDLLNLPQGRKAITDGVLAAHPDLSGDALNKKVDAVIDQTATFIGTNAESLLTIFGKEGITAIGRQLGAGKLTAESFKNPMALLNDPAMASVRDDVFKRILDGNQVEEAIGNLNFSALGAEAAYANAGAAFLSSQKDDEGKSNLDILAGLAPQERDVFMSAIGQLLGQKKNQQALSLDRTTADLALAKVSEANFSDPKFTSALNTLLDDRILPELNQKIATEQDATQKAELTAKKMKYNVFLKGAITMANTPGSSWVSEDPVGAVIDQAAAKEINALVPAATPPVPQQGDAAGAKRP